jgi:hypothetical protein
MIILDNKYDLVKFVNKSRDIKLNIKIFKYIIDNNLKYYNSNNNIHINFNDFNNNNINDIIFIVNKYNKDK